MQDWIKPAAQCGSFSLSGAETPGTGFPRRVVGSKRSRNIIIYIHSPTAGPEPASSLELRGANIYLTCEGEEGVDPKVLASICGPVTIRKSHIHYFNRLKGSLNNSYNENAILFIHKHKRDHQEIRKLLISC